MRDATNLLTTTRNALIDLVYSQKKGEQEQKKPDALSDEAEQRDKYGKTVIVFALVLFFFVYLNVYCGCCNRNCKSIYNREENLSLKVFSSVNKIINHHK